MAGDTTTFASFKTQLTKGTPAPVYLIHGEEGYYIDALLKIAEGIIPEADRDFDLSIIYAPQVEVDDVIDACHRYPMMSPRQVVIVKEVQSQGTGFLKNLKDYMAAPAPTTILFLAYRGESVKGAEILNAVKKGGGVAFESKKLRDSALAATIQEFIKSRGLSVDPKALSMLSDFVGSDLSRLYNEINKLTVTLGPGAMVTPEAVERNIGMSKEFNNFELVSAIANRDIAKALRIVDYFQKNPKKNPVQMLTPLLFTFFSNLLIAHYSPDKSERGLLGALGLKWPGQLREINQGVVNYRPAQVVEILSLLRSFDGMSKGNGSRMDAHELLQATVYRIMTTPGKL
ncbi:MAG: DNA polymerase III subunit delta [Clostridiales bacterium]|nr:DNA polymerase III subunit delta [Clostridiales bacterium]